MVLVPYANRTSSCSRWLFELGNDCKKSSVSGKECKLFIAASKLNPTSFFPVRIYPSLSSEPEAHSFPMHTNDPFYNNPFSLFFWSLDSNDGWTHLIGLGTPPTPDSTAGVSFRCKEWLGVYIRKKELVLQDISGQTKIGTQKEHLAQSRAKLHHCMALLLLLLQWMVNVKVKEKITFYLFAFHLYGKPTSRSKSWTSDDSHPTSPFVLQQQPVYVDGQ